MRRRYNLTRSDNYPYTGRKSYRCSGDGFVSIVTGFPVTSVIVTWSSIPFYDVLQEMSSSSSSSEGYSTSSSNGYSTSSSSSSNQYSTSSSSSSKGYSTSSSSSSSSSSSFNDEYRIGNAVIGETFIIGYGEPVSSSSSLSSLGNSSSSSSSSSSSIDSSSSSSSSSIDSSSSSSSYGISSSSSSSSSSSEGYSSSSSSSSNAWHGEFNQPRLYIYSLQDNGFTVKYENVPEELGYIEFSYIAS